MKISYCDDIGAAAKLWSICFPGDSLDFVRFYMDRVHRERDALVLRGAEGDPRAYLGMVPYEMELHETRVPCSYLSGVCTLPQFRGRGYMTAMMEQALAQMYQRGDVLSLLIPAKPTLYLKFGYIDCFFLEQKPLPSGKGEGKLVKSSQNLNRWYELDCRRRFDGFLHRSREQWQILLEEHVRFERGELWENDGAYALVNRFPEKTVVKECMGEQEAVRSLLCRIGEGVMLSPDSQKAFGQARVIHAEKALAMAEDCFVNVSDPWIPQNNGSFSVRSGQVTREKGGGRPMKIEELTALVMGGKNYMNLMLN